MIAWGFPDILDEPKDYSFSTHTPKGSRVVKRHAYANVLQ